MARNVEIKARAHNFRAQLSLATNLAKRSAEVIVQRDTFFNVAEGRLKLRVFADESAQLIYYRRADQAEAKLSEYTISAITDPISLLEILSTAYGVSAQVNKTRSLIMHGRTRMHFDQVDSLGDFIELEVVLDDAEEVSAAQLEAKQLMHSLTIAKEDLIEVAYADMLSNAKT